MLWRIEPEWQGETAFIIGGGTSVTGQELSLLTGRRVIAVNSSYEAYPAADILFFTDRRWFYDHWKRPAFEAFAGRKVTCSNADFAGCTLHRLARVTPNLDPKHGALGPGLASDRASVVSNRTSLQGAMNLAVHLGVTRMVLLGADMCRAEDGRSHHHAPHRWRNKPGNRTWDIQLTQLQLLVEPLKTAGIEIINTSPISRIEWWPKQSLADAVALPA